MKIYNEITQGTPEWFEVRLGKLTASKATAIATAGRGLETLVYEKAAELITRKLPDAYTNQDIERGKELEHKARNAYEIETGNVVHEVGFIELDEFTGCSPDGLVGNDGLVEIKCPKDSVFIKYLYTGKVDTGYMWQMQMQMHVTSRKWVDYVVYNPNFRNPLIIKRIDRDEAKIKKIKEGLATGKAKLQSILEKING